MQYCTFQNICSSEIDLTFFSTLKRYMTSEACEKSLIKFRLCNTLLCVKDVLFFLDSLSYVAKVIPPESHVFILTGVRGIWGISVELLPVALRYSRKH